jgi:hypothetical protein
VAQDADRPDDQEQDDAVDGSAAMGLSPTGAIGSFIPTLRGLGQQGQTG